MNKIKTNIYNIYYRKRKEQLLFGSKNLLDFKKIRNPFGRWAADPFLIEYNGCNYIYAEMASIITRKGDIYCINIDDKKPKWKKCIRNKFHMSFPNVFLHNNCYYMVPETAQDYQVAIYKAIKMPYKWAKETTLLYDEKNHPVDNISLPDSCYPFDDSFITYIKQKNEFYLALYLKTNGFFCQTNKTKDLNRRLRPAGQFFNYREKLFYPSQNCEKTYGGGLIINSVKLSNNKNDILFIPEFEITPLDVFRSKLCANCVGIHTYNLNENYEVIDIITSRYSLLAIFGKIIRLFQKK
ncbi:MAG: hypothetical protein HUJ68_09895, partial [Clostridia bacterium]|nr:hypothetical protein [Clostridia bacterium]